MGKKFVGLRPNTSLAESQFKKINCHSVKMNYMKEYFASFITKPLKSKICPNFAAVNDNLKILHISVVFIFGQYQ